MSRARDIADIGEDVTSLATDAELSSGLASKLDFAGGKILQIVRANDTTTRSTTSLSFTDVTGMSVTITPQKSDSAILIVSAFSPELQRSGVGDNVGSYQITDSSNNPINGAERVSLRGRDNDRLATQMTMIAYATPATTSSVTYKLRFRVDNSQSTNVVVNANCTGQMYAIEVSA